MSQLNGTTMLIRPYTIISSYNNKAAPRANKPITPGVTAAAAPVNVEDEDAAAPAFVVEAPDLVVVESSVVAAPPVCPPVALDPTAVEVIVTPAGDVVDAGDALVAGVEVALTYVVVEAETEMEEDEALLVVATPPA